MKTMSAFAVMTMVGVVGAAVASARTASACGDGLWEPPPPEEVSVMEAEQLLDEGSDAEAASKISSRFWFIRQALPHAQTVPVVQRAIRVLALASARHGGAVAVGDTGWVTSDFTRERNRPVFDAARQQNLDWSVSRLRMLDKATPSSAGASDLAEALSLNPKTRVEGKQKLETLFAANQLVGHHAMNQLTRLRAEAGDLAGAKVVAARCVTQNGAGCEAPSAAPAVAAK